MKALDFLDAPVPEGVRLFLISGPEAFLREQAATHVTSTLGGDCEIVHLRVGPGDETIVLSDVLDELRMAGLFSGRDRLVRLTGADSLVKEHGAALERFIASGEALHPWIIEGESLAPKRLKGRPRSGLARAVVDAGGIVVTCQALYDTSFGGKGPVWQSPLSRWVQQRARGLGKRLSLKDAYQIHRLAGRDLRVLDAELHKLAAYAGERPELTADDVEQVVARGRLGAAYELADAVAAGDVPQALDRSARLFENGLADSGGRIVRDPASIALILQRTLTNRLLRVLQVVELMRGGMSFEDAAGAVGQPPWGRDRLRRQAEVLAAPGRGLRLVRGLRELEEGLKGGGGPPRTLVERFLVEAPGAGSPAGGAAWTR